MWTKHSHPCRYGWIRLDQVDKDLWMNCWLSHLLPSANWTYSYALRYSKDSSRHLPNPKQKLFRTASPVCRTTTHYLSHRLCHFQVSALDHSNCSHQNRVDKLQHHFPQVSSFPCVDHLEVGLLLAQFRTLIPFSTSLSQILSQYT